MEKEVLAGVIAGIVSILVAVVSFLSNRAATRHQIRQSQYVNVIAKRIELYPQLWEIHIFYETNWVYEGKPKDRAWAREYLARLNTFNLSGGLFFSQDLYVSFAELRKKLDDAQNQTAEGALVEASLVEDIRECVYGTSEKPGLSTYLKDDLGSYRNTSLARRASDA